jgi:hypothetical protein
MTRITNCASMLASSWTIDRNVYLQVNTQAKSSSLKKWLQKEGSHGKLGSAQYDTQAADLDAEAQRVVDDLVGQGKDKL